MASCAAAANTQSGAPTRERSSMERLLKPLTTSGAGKGRLPAGPSARWPSARHSAGQARSTSQARGPRQNSCLKVMTIYPRGADASPLAVSSPIPPPLGLLEPLARATGHSTASSSAAAARR